MLAPLIKLLGIICKKKGHTAWFIDYSSWLHNLVTRLSVKEDFFYAQSKKTKKNTGEKKMTMTLTPKKKISVLNN